MKSDSVTDRDELDRPPSVYRLADGMRDGAGLCGLGLLTAGCWMLSVPLALIVSGAVLLGLAIKGAHS